MDVVVYPLLVARLLFWLVLRLVGIHFSFFWGFVEARVIVKMWLWRIVGHIRWRWVIMIDRRRVVHLHGHHGLHALVHIIIVVLLIPLI